MAEPELLLGEHDPDVVENKRAIVYRNLRPGRYAVVVVSRSRSLRLCGEAS